MLFDDFEVIIIKYFILKLNKLNYMNYSLQTYNFIINIAITEKGEKLPSLKTVSSLTVFSEIDKVKLNSSFLHLLY